METPWYIIADDFTGSGDSAVQFSTGSRPARLALDVDRLTRSDGRSCSAFVLDSDSRYFGGREAYDAVRSMAERLKAVGAVRFYKKIDSTLRGNIADEVAAVMDGAGFATALVCPAAPRNGRTVRDGLCLVEGQPVGSHGAARDRFTPVGEARISFHFEGRFNGSVAALPLAAVRSGRQALLSEAKRLAAAGARVLVCDAETMDDLKALVGLAELPGTLPVGSSGFAEALAAADGALGEWAGGAGPAAIARASPGESLFVVGSLTPTSAVQCGRLLAAGETADVVADSEEAIGRPTRELALVLERARAVPAASAILLRSDSIVPPLPEEEVRRRGASISKFLGRAACAIAEARGTRFLFASGGDTAARIIRSLGADYIDFTQEMMPGLPYGRFKSVVLGRELGFASKSGGFGGPEALAEVLSMVARGRCRRGREGSA